MVNKVILLGNLGKDPLIRRTESGVPVATFSIATSETYKDKAGEKQEKTEWHNIVMWRGLAEVAEKYLKKGSRVYIEGKLTTRSYEQEGITKYITEVVAQQMVMISNGNSNGGYTPAPLPVEELATAGYGKASIGSNGNSLNESHTSYSDSGDSDDELPF